MRPGLFSQIEVDQRIEIVNGVGPTSVSISGGEVVELRFIGDGAGASAARLDIEVQGAGAVLLETYEVSAGVVMSVELNIAVDAASGLERIVVCEGGEDAILVSRADVKVWPESELFQTILTSGGRRQRVETHVAHPGQNTRVRLDGVYVNAGQAHSDITTVVTHSGVGGTTDQLIKGVVSDQARGVFQGRIVVAHGADKTDARMGHHALILSERAEIDAKPELEIYADDVACAHGNTVGALDEDALFYARQRGIPEAEARALLTEAFLGEVVDRISDDAAREVAAAWLADKLRGGE